jgi:hypothetical protein
MLLQVVQGHQDEAVEDTQGINQPDIVVGLAQNPEAAESEHVRSLLETYQVNTVIVGHTPDLGIITPRFGGSVIITDTGIAAYYGSHKDSLLVENGLKFALQDGEYIPLPVDEEGIIPYFREMLELEPENRRLAVYLENLINPPPAEEAVEAATEAVAD